MSPVARRAARRTAVLMRNRRGRRHPRESRKPMNQRRAGDTASGNAPKQRFVLHSYETPPGAVIWPWKIAGRHGVPVAKCLHKPLAAPASMPAVGFKFGCCLAAAGAVYALLRGVCVQTFRTPCRRSPMARLLHGTAGSVETSQETGRQPQPALQRHSSPHPDHARRLLLRQTGQAKGRAGARLSLPKMLAVRKAEGTAFAATPTGRHEQRRRTVCLLQQRHLRPRGHRRRIRVR